MFNLAEELLLLVMDEDNGEATSVPARTLSYALAGAVLLELALQGRIDTGLEILEVTDPTPLKDDLLDPVLSDIVEVSKDGPRNPEFWVRRVAERSEELRSLTLERLAAAGVVEADDTGFFSLSRLVARARRYPAIRRTARTGSMVPGIARHFQRRHSRHPGYRHHQSGQRLRRIPADADARGVCGGARAD